MFSVGTIPASANTGRSAAWTPKQAPRGSGAGAGPETPEVAARSTGPPGGALSDHGDPDEAPTGEWRVRGPAFFAPHPSSARRAMRLRPLRSLPRVPRPSPLVPTSTQSPFCARASRSPAVPSGLSGAGPGHCAHLSQVAGPVDGGDPDAVVGFLNWCRRVGLELSPKVAVSRQGTVAGYGMVARESVQAGELLFVVPRAALLSQHTCSIGGLLERGTKTEAERLLAYERWDFLCKLEMVGEEGAFVIGREEVLTEEELITTLKVLCMPAEEFRELKDQDGGGDNKREEGSLTITNIPKLKASWRQLLRNSVLLTLQTYATDLKTDQDLLSNKEVYAQLSWREQQALQVRYGQKMILHQLLELTQVGSFPVP
nr:N-lysine methyltransferase SETD6 isoform X10 [Macaca fascicularis]